MKFISGFSPPAWAGFVVLLLTIAIVFAAVPTVASPSGTVIATISPHTSQAFAMIIPATINSPPATSMVNGAIININADVGQASALTTSARYDNDIGRNIASSHDVTSAQEAVARSGPFTAKGMAPPCYTVLLC